MSEHPTPGAQSLTDAAQPEAVQPRAAQPEAAQPPPDRPGDPASGRPRTGNARVDAALDRLDDLHDRPAADHVEIYEDVHRRLQEALADPDGG